MSLTADRAELANVQRTKEFLSEPETVSGKIQASLECAPHLALLGDCSKFGDGDGTFWDRWLTSPPPARGSESAGHVKPKSGFKKRNAKRREEAAASAEEGFSAAIKTYMRRKENE